MRAHACFILIAIANCQTCESIKHTYVLISGAQPGWRLEAAHWCTHGERRTAMLLPARLRCGPVSASAAHPATVTGAPYCFLSRHRCRRCYHRLGTEFAHEHIRYMRIHYTPQIDITLLCKEEVLL